MLFSIPVNSSFLMSWAPDTAHAQQMFIYYTLPVGANSFAIIMRCEKLILHSGPQLTRL